MSVQSLFESRSRHDRHHQRADETTYEFLDRVDDPVFERVRNAFNQWMQRFCASQTHDAAGDLFGRFRSKQDQQFYAAFWELYLHEVYSRLGFEVNVHPESATGARPDFLVSRGGHRFYLEAVMPSPSTGAPSEPRSVRMVLDHIDAAHHTDFVLAVRFVSAGKDTPKKSEVVSVVQGWLGSLAWEDPPAHPTGTTQASFLETELGVRDWVVGLRAIPRRAAKRGDPSVRMVAVYPAITGWPDSVAAALGRKLDEKANKYGDLGAPYVLALWTMSVMASDRTAPQALFGGTVPLEDGSHATELSATADGRTGLWTRNRAHRGRVSAVLAVPSFDFNYSAVSRVLPRLWLNPWASAKLATAQPFPTSEVSEDERAITNLPASLSASSLMDLPIDWPGRPFQVDR